jgi:hypothetical protein
MYLGLLFIEYLNYTDMAKSGSRSLGLLIAKCKDNGGFEYSIFTKLADSRVISEIEYGASIWGSNTISCIYAVKNRAMCFFFDVRKYTPN